MRKPNETSFPCCSHSPSVGDKLSIEACNDWLYFTCRENGERAEVVLDRSSAQSLRDKLTAWLGDGDEKPVAWFTEDHATDKSATTWDEVTAARWKERGWPVGELFARGPLEFKS